MKDFGQPHTIKKKIGLTFHTQIQQTQENQQALNRAKSQPFMRVNLIQPLPLEN